jgi:hypothetical protein
MEDEEQQVRNELSRDYLRIREEGSFMFDNIDSFIALSRDNTSVDMLDFYPFDRAPGDYEFWDKVGQIVGNLTELEAIRIDFLPYTVDDDGDADPIPDWKTLALILPYLRRKVMLYSSAQRYDAEVEDIQGLARAIRGNPMISKFSSDIGFTFANLGPWCSALATLPSLERVTFSLREPETVDQRALLNLEPFKELLRTPALRFVSFDDFYFTNELCHATANALEEGSSIIEIIFDPNCIFPAGGTAIIANALKTNVTVTAVQFLDDCDESFCNTLATVLLCNSTLQNLALCLLEDAGGKWLPSTFLSLRRNTTLNSLTADICDEFGDELCAAIRNGLSKNSTLVELSLDYMLTSDVDGALSARNALSFLRINSTLKSLTVSFAPTQNKSYVSAFRLEAVEMLNPFLESLTIVEKEVLVLVLVLKSKNCLHFFLRSNSTQR